MLPTEPRLPSEHPLHDDELVCTWLPVLYRHWLAAGAPMPVHDGHRPHPRYGLSWADPWTETYFWPNLLSDMLNVYATGLRQIRNPPSL